MSDRVEAPPDEIEAPPVVLRRHVVSDAPALIAAINESLGHLAPWMAWAQAPADEASVGEFLAGSIASFEVGRDFGYALRERGSAPDGPIVGGCGLHARGGPGVIEIGYWVHAAQIRRGIARAAATALRDEAFAMGIERVEIHCDERNTASAAVARSCGFALAGIVPRERRIPKDPAGEMVWFAERERS